MVVSIVKGKCRDISSVSQRVERVGEGRIVNLSDGSFLNCLQASKRIFGDSSSQIIAIFETRADLGLVEGVKVQGREKSLGPE